ncbi:hypothetical protein BKA62DRAFT_349341 [Auriculariales sp. MPI-PUGE-AT-0066]|nr:hypothetical protein BKA62DRAFT_349341 [Auriculariales sp. MPI-PUGE-AT-0066]
MSDVSSIFDWTEANVCSWLHSIGFEQYDANITRHGISGDILPFLDAEQLKEIGVSTIGQRLAILKAVYHLKLQYNIPIEADSYVPPSELNEGHEVVSLERLNELVREQGERLRMLEDENRLLLDRFHSFEEHTQPKRTQPVQGPVVQEHTLTRQPSFKWAQYVKPAKSPTKATLEAAIDSPRSSPQAMEHEVPPIPTNKQNLYRSQQNVTPPTPASGPSRAPNIKTAPNVSSNPPPPSNTQPPEPSSSTSSTSDNLKSFKVSLDDPAWKVLPAALKKYKINNDDWQNYAMFICYGNTERCLSYDEKPLLLFQRLKEAKKNPVFMLKHIKDIRSPIAVAKQKQAQRQKAAGDDASSGVTSNGARPTLHPPIIKTGAPQAGAAPSLDVLSPGGADGLAKAHAAEVPEEQASGSAPSKSRTGTGASNNSDEDWVITPSGVSYAVSIYPYMAEQDDELDVVVGDYYIILHRARGWWNVQCDPAGTGVVDTEHGKSGWVPAGCLLETRVPVAQAVSEASGSASPTALVEGKNPILPLSIISTSFPGVALTDYHKKGDEELELRKDDSLRVFKRYNHWSYAVKEHGGDRGWVPSWFIGKASASGTGPTSVQPPTPGTTGQPPPINTSAASQQATTLLETELRYAASSVESPLSPGFPHGNRQGFI